MDQQPDLYPDDDPAARPRSRWPGPLLIGGAVAAVLGLIALVVLLSPLGRSEPQRTAQASPGSLSVGVSQAPPDGFAADQPLRCFVDGRFSGLQTLAECARLNGVDARQLDVGVDDTGALAAATDTVLAPPPAELFPDIETAQTEATLTPPSALPPLERPAPPPLQPVAATGPCWRDAGGGNWRREGDDLTLEACTRLLFDGQCVVQPGSALYGRWAEETLRLVPGRVEAGRDGRRFRTLERQSPGSCYVG